MCDYIPVMCVDPEPYDGCCTDHVCPNGEIGRTYSKNTRIKHYLFQFNASSELHKFSGITCMHGDRVVHHNKDTDITLEELGMSHIAGARCWVHCSCPDPFKVHYDNATTAVAGSCHFGCVAKQNQCIRTKEYRLTQPITVKKPQLSLHLNLPRRINIMYQPKP